MVSFSICDRLSASRMPMTVFSGAWLDAGNGLMDVLCAEGWLMAALNVALRASQVKRDTPVSPAGLPVQQSAIRD